MAISIVSNVNQPRMKITSCLLYLGGTPDQQSQLLLKSDRQLSNKVV